MSRERPITVDAYEMRKWRDTMRTEIDVLESGDEPSFIGDRSLDGISFLDRIVASIDSYLILNDADWPEED